jgi:aminoglycoside phosphotransferase (APT) family kinase protein
MDGMRRPSATAAESRLHLGITDASDVAPYLASRGLLEARAVVDGRLRIEDVSRKNRVFLVTAENGPGYVVKLAAQPGDGGVAREAAVLERLGELAPLVPRRVLHDAATGVLVLATPAGARDLAEQQAGGRLSLTLARAAGRALAALHALPPRVLDGLPPADPHELLAIHRPDLATVRGLSAAGVEVVRLVQNADAVCAQLDQLLAAPRRECVIHGDLRWDNLLALGSAGSSRRTRLLLVDWELASAGDPALDLGAYFAELLRAWKQRAGIPDPSAPGRRLVDPVRALPAMRPAAARFWGVYAQCRAGPKAELEPLLRRALQFAGARLVLGAVEEAQMLSELDHNVRSTLQLGTNVLARPGSAAADLLGLQVPS